MTMAVASGCARWAQIFLKHKNPSYHKCGTCFWMSELSTYIFRFGLFFSCFFIVLFSLIYFPSSGLMLWAKCLFETLRQLFVLFFVKSAALATMIEMRKRGFICFVVYKIAAFVVWVGLD